MSSHRDASLSHLSQHIQAVLPSVLVLFLRVCYLQSGFVASYSSGGRDKGFLNPVRTFSEMQPDSWLRWRKEFHLEQASVKQSWRYMFLRFVFFFLNSMYVCGRGRAGYVVVNDAACGSQHLISLELERTDSCEPSYCMTRAKSWVSLHYMCLTTEPSCQPMEFIQKVEFS